MTRTTMIVLAVALTVAVGYVYWNEARTPGATHGPAESHGDDYGADALTPADLAALSRAGFDMAQVERVLAEAGVDAEARAAWRARLEAAADNAAVMDATLAELRALVVR